VAAVVPSRRELIFRRVLTALQSVTVANGFECTLAYVRRGDADPLALPAFPAALILPVSDEPDSGPTSVNRHRLLFAVRVWVREVTEYAEGPYPLEPTGDPPSTIHQQLETVLTAVARAMMRDPVWGGLAMHTDERRVQYLLLDTSYAECGADIEYAVDYRTSVEDVTVPPAVLAMTATPSERLC
jgi:hypothetical protein